jgi:hypothetical protein
VLWHFFKVCTMNYRLLFVLLMSAFLGVGCSTKMAYLSAQEMQRAQCDRQTDLQELQRCRSQLKQSYEDYQRQREAENL